MMDDFVYDDAEHIYRLRGTVIPSITQVLKLTGFIDDTYFSEWYAKRGTNVHLACQYLIEGDLDMGSVDESIRPRVERFEKFLSERKPQLIFAEVPLVNRIFRFAGTEDLFVNLDGVLSLIEIKSGKAKLAAKLQSAGQKLLINCIPQYAGKVVRRFALELPEKGNYKLIPHGDRSDEIMFLNAVGMVHKRINEGELNLEKELKIL